VNQPVDPDGCVVDVARTCCTALMSFYVDSSATQRVRFYRVPPGAPVLPFPHRFGRSDMYLDRPQDDPLPGQVGIWPSSVKYDKGALPPVYLPNGHYVGTASQWQDGSVSTHSPNLTWTAAAFSAQCLHGLGVALAVPAFLPQRDPFSGFEVVG
jgi:hypothetical protein